MNKLLDNLSSREFLALLDIVWSADLLWSRLDIAAQERLIDRAKARASVYRENKTPEQHRKDLFGS